jgi:hypothetical protein
MADSKEFASQVMAMARRRKTEADERITKNS